MVATPGDFKSSGMTPTQIVQFCNGHANLGVQVCARSVALALLFFCCCCWRAWCAHYWSPKPFWGLAKAFWVAGFSAFKGFGLHISA